MAPAVGSDERAGDHVKALVVETHAATISTAMIAATAQSTQAFRPGRCQ
jgi:hypothetical protein